MKRLNKKQKKVIERWVDTNRKSISDLSTIQWYEMTLQKSFTDMYLSAAQLKYNVPKNEFANYALNYYRKKYYILSVLNLYRKKAMGGNMDQVSTEMKRSTKQQYLNEGGNVP